MINATYTIRPLSIEKENICGLKFPANDVLTSTLITLDELYKTTISKLPIDSRLSYCIKHLDKIQSVLTKNAGALDRKQKEQLREMIEATQGEIEKLNRK